MPEEGKYQLAQITTEENMRKSHLALLLIGFLMLFALTACGGGTSTNDQGTQGQSQADTPDQPDPEPEPAEPEMLDLTGTDPAELFIKWEELGEPMDDLELWGTDADMEPYEILEWHITEIEEGVKDVYEGLTLEPGIYIIQVVAGAGAVHFDAWVYAGDELLSDDLAEDSYPLMYVDIEEPTVLKVEIEAVDLADDAEMVKYCWFVY